MQQQLNLLSISIAEKARRSTPPCSESHTMPRDVRISDEQAMTVIVGGFPSAHSELACTTWINEQIETVCGTKPVRSYCKGEFKGLMWLKFDSGMTRDRVIELTSKAQLSMHHSRIWIAPDSPLPVRVEKKFLFSFKNLLLSWGWQGFETRVNIEARNLTIDNQVVVVIDAHDH